MTGTDGGRRNGGNDPVGGRIAAPGSHPSRHHPHHPAECFRFCAGVDPSDRIRTILLIFLFVKITFIPAARWIGFWFLSQLFDAGQVAHAQTGGVAYLAHVGGFIFGRPRHVRSRALSEVCGFQVLGPGGCADFGAGGRSKAKSKATDRSVRSTRRLLLHGYCFVALSRKVATLALSFDRSASWRYIMWPAS